MLAIADNQRSTILNLAICRCIFEWIEFCFEFFIALLRENSIENETICTLMMIIINGSNVNIAATVWATISLIPGRTIIEFGSQKWMLFIRKILFLFFNFFFSVFHFYILRNLRWWMRFQKEKKNICETISTMFLT